MTAMRCATSACGPGPRPARTLGGEPGRQVRQHQRDGLRVLVGEEGDDLPVVQVVQEGERQRHERLPRPGRGSRRRGRPPRSPRAGPAPRPGRRAVLEPWSISGLELVEHRGADLRRDGGDPRDLDRQLLELGLVELREHLRRLLPAEGEHEHRRLLARRDGRGRIGDAGRARRRRRSSAQPSFAFSQLDSTRAISSGRFSATSDSDWRCAAANLASAEVGWPSAGAVGVGSSS